MFIQLVILYCIYTLCMFLKNVMSVKGLILCVLIAIPSGILLYPPYECTRGTIV
jgi:hypothetical protein